MGQKIKGVIFDLDGTLIDSLEVYVKALNEGLKEYNVPPITRQELARYLNQATPIEEILRNVSRKFQDQDLNRECKEKVFKAYLEFEPEEIPLLPNVRELLQELKDRGLKIGILTARTSVGENKWREIKRLNIADYVDVIISAGESKRKPDPDGIFKCLEELGLSKNNVIFVGDSVADVQTGKNAKVYTVAVITGVGSPEDLKSTGADNIIENIMDLLSIIEKESL